MVRLPLSRTLALAAFVLGCSPTAESPGGDSPPTVDRGTGGTGAPTTSTGGSPGTTGGGNGGTGGGSGGTTSGSSGTGGTPAAASGGAEGGGSAAGGAGAPEAGVSPSADAAPAPAPMVTDPGTEGDGDVMVSPPFNYPPEATLAAGVTAGKLGEVAVTSKIFAGRTVQVYIPNGYTPGSTVPFMVLHDGPSYIRNFKLNTVLDNMIAKKELPLMVAIFVPNGGGMRSFEYDSTTDANARFITEEVLPAVEKALPVKLTTDPEGRCMGGHSSGGIAAFTVGWHLPDKYHRILSHSGSFVNINNRGGNKFPGMIKEAPAKPLRVFLSVGTKDNGGWHQANVNMAAALKEKAYHYRFVVMTNGTHNQADPASMLPDSLRWLWRGYPIAGK